jgi:hypothetical protein
MLVVNNQENLEHKEGKNLENMEDRKKLESGGVAE